jgi:hypothetical protein
VKKLNILVAGMVTALAIVAIGCGGSDEPEPEVSVPEENPQVVSPGGGLVKPSTFLTFEGARYELVHFMQVDMTDKSEFRSVGEASEADIDLTGEATVYQRDADPDAVYTLAPATEDDVAMWLRWRKS